MVLGVGTVACNTGGGGKAAGGNPACASGTVDVSKISGVWIKEILHNDGRKEQVTEFRMSVDPSGAKWVAGINVAVMDKQASEGKLTLRQQVSPEDEANFKKYNKDPDMSLRSLIDVRPKARGCKVEIMERYETYIDGKRSERRTDTVQFPMVPYTGSTPLSFEVCTRIKELKLGKGAKGGAAEVGKPVQVISQGKAKDLGGADCKPFSDLFVSGKLVLKGVEGRVDGDKVYWEVEHGFAAPANSRATQVWTEIHQFAQCGGSRKLVGVACNVVNIL